MEFEIVENENWMRGGRWALLENGKEIMVADDKKILAHYAVLLISEREE